MRALALFVYEWHHNHATISETAMMHTYSACVRNVLRMQYYEKDRAKSDHLAACMYLSCRVRLLFFVRLQRENMDSHAQ